MCHHYWMQYLFAKHLFFLGANNEVFEDPGWGCVCVNDTPLDLRLLLDSLLLSLLLLRRGSFLLCRKVRDSSSSDDPLAFCQTRVCL